MDEQEEFGTLRNLIPEALDEIRSQFGDCYFSLFVDHQYIT